MEIQLIEADLSNTRHAADMLAMLNEYAAGITGGGEDLSDEVKHHLVERLRSRYGVEIILAYHVEVPVALAICFEGFSTFYAQPLLNIHDFVVKEAYRGKGIAKLLLDKIESIALRRNCCKLTLEVLEGNTRAQKIYKEFGFAGYELDATMGKALFWEKALK